MTTSTDSSRSRSTATDERLLDGTSPNTASAQSTSEASDLLHEDNFIIPFSNDPRGPNAAGPSDSDDYSALDFPVDATDADDAAIDDLASTAPSRGSILPVEDRSIRGNSTRIPDIGGSYDAFSRDPREPDVPEDILNGGEVRQGEDNPTQLTILTVPNLTILSVEILNLSMVLATEQSVLKATGSSNAIH